MVYVHWKVVKLLQPLIVRGAKKSATYSVFAVSGFLFAYKFAYKSPITKN